MTTRSTAAGVATALARSRAGLALQRPANWVQLAKFCTVGATGYAVNLTVYALLLRMAGVHYLVAAGLEKIPAQALAVILVTPINFLGNKLWSFSPRTAKRSSANER